MGASDFIFLCFFSYMSTDGVDSPGDCILAIGQLLFNRRANRWIAFWLQTSPGDCILAAGHISAKAKGMLIVFAACGIVLLPVD